MTATSRLRLFPGVVVPVLLGVVLVAGGCTPSPGPSGGTASPAASPPSAPPSSSSATPAAPSPTPSGSPSPAVSSPSAAPSTAAPSASSAAVVVDVFLAGPSAADDCQANAAVKRTVSARTPEAALRALLAGPTAAELAAGYSSWFSSRTANALLAIDVASGLAKVSFRDLRPIIPNASSSCGSALLLSSLDRTLEQFPDIRATRYSFGGDETAFYEWLQMSAP